MGGMRTEHEALRGTAHSHMHACHVKGSADPQQKSQLSSPADSLSSAPPSVHRAPVVYAPAQPPGRGGMATCTVRMRCAAAPAGAVVRVRKHSQR